MPSSKSKKNALRRLQGTEQKGLFIRRKEVDRVFISTTKSGALAGCPVVSPDGTFYMSALDGAKAVGIQQSKVSKDARVRAPGGWRFASVEECKKHGFVDLIPDQKPLPSSRPTDMRRERARQARLAAKRAATGVEAEKIETPNGQSVEVFRIKSKKNKNGSAVETTTLRGTPSLRAVRWPDASVSLFVTSTLVLTFTADDPRSQQIVQAVPPAQVN